MKLLYFDDFRLGVLKGEDTVVDVSAVVDDIPHTGPHDLINGLIERFEEYRGRLESAVASGQGIPLAGLRIRPPLPRPENIVCMAVNYMEGKSEPAPINTFGKASTAVIGHGDTLVMQDIPASIFEGEAEMAMVIGKYASNVPAAEARQYIFGYLNFIDGSARDMPTPNNSFYQVKSRATFAPIGPYLVTADEIPDPQHVQIKLTNNGKVFQEFNTDDMAHNINRCVEFVTAMHPLLPGDILATGTNHGGLNPFMDGDVVELQGEGLGLLRINVRDDLKRTWARETRGERIAKGLQGTTPQLTGKYAQPSK